MANKISTPGLSRLVRALSRHKKKSAAVFLFAVLVSGGVAIFAPKSYHSQGMLLIRLGKENATLDPTVTMGHEPVVTVPQSRDNELNSVVEILKSHAIAEKVVDALGTDFVLEHSTAASASTGQPGRAARVVQQLQQAGRKPSSFSIGSNESRKPTTATAPSPGSCRAVASRPPSDRTSFRSTAKARRPSGASGSWPR